MLGGRIPKGILLVGPPGTGKTLLAKAIAGEAGVPFFSLSGSDFVEMFVGVGAARVRDMFQQAEAKAPCIIFIDELDALGKTRGSSVVGGHDEREQTLNALLVEMDGFDTNSGVIVLAASNRPETLDPALLRPGRFDRHVLVDRPDVRGREAILEVHVQNVKLDDTVRLKDVAAITSGFVGADLANLVNEAALLAARKGKSAVGMDEFNEGVERVTAGLEKKQRIIHEDEKLRVAYHEVGPRPGGLQPAEYRSGAQGLDHSPRTGGPGLHAAAARRGSLPDDARRTGKPHPGAAGRHRGRGNGVRRRFDRRQNDLERASAIARSMVMDYGMSRLGRVNYRESSRSPFLSSGGEMTREHSHSEQTAREIDQEVKRIIDESMEKVRHILETRLASLRALSNRLIEKEVIDSDELKKIIEENSPSPLIVPGTAAERKRVAADPSNNGPKAIRPRACERHGRHARIAHLRLTGRTAWSRRIETGLPLHIPVICAAQGQLDHAGDLQPADRFRQHRKRLGPLGLRISSSSRPADSRMQGSSDLNLLDPADRLQARQPRHVHVQQQQMHFLVADDLQRFFAVAGQQGTKAPRLEHDPQCLAEIVIVVGDQDRR